MRLDQLTSTSKVSRKRIGRGNGSRGTYSGRGMKGQKSRSGGGVRPSFEGGQNPLVKRLPTQRGFVNIFKTQYSIVNLDTIYQKLGNNTEVTPSSMHEAKVVRTLNMPIKILGRGDLINPIVINAHRFSREAREKIEAAGGKAVMIQP